MVDLAKIRKKAKKSPAQSSSRPVAEPTSESSSLRVDESTSESSSLRVDESTSEAPASATPVPSALPPADSPTRRPGNSTTSKLDRFKETAGKRRVAQMEQIELVPHALLELLTFIIAGEQYAVDIERIVEIVTPRSVTRIPNADTSIVGIISLRGTIVTLVDVRGKLRHPQATAAGDDERIVVIDFRNETIGFVVDRVLRVVKIAPSELEPHPVVHAIELEAAIRGVFRASGSLTILLDLDKLLDSRAVAARSA